MRGAFRRSPALRIESCEGMNTDSPIDLVFLWCDDADKRWHAKRTEAARRCGLTDDGYVNGACRYAGRNDLKYALRSVGMHVPWIRNVIVVMDRDISAPAWLDERAPRLQIVRLDEIMPAECLPCFCSDTMEHFLARIPGLSERFLYANDDMMFYKDTPPSFFFAPDGWPYFRFGGRRRAAPTGKRRMYYRNLENAERLIAAEFRMKVGLNSPFGRSPHHNVDAYCRSDLLVCHERFKDVIERHADYPFRHEDNIQRHVYALYSIATGHGHFRRARFNTGLGNPFLSLLPSRADSLQFSKWRSGLTKLERFKPNLFCFNDTIGISEDDRDWLEKSVYRKLFPRPSPFERPEVTT